MKIAVNGQQYVWRYSYPGKDQLLVYTDMVVPVGMTVLLDITADDVVHSWWIPKLGGKMDAVPGYVEQDLVPDPAGRDPGGPEAGGLRRASAPSCAAATTRTCTPA